MNTVAVVTAKRFTAAKQRMTGAVPVEKRLALVEAMLGDVLEAITEARQVTFTVVVTGEAAAAGLATGCGAEVIHDPDDAGHIGAAMLGVDRARELGADAVMLLPGDCPLLKAREIDHLVTGLPDPFVTVVPDRHGTGTNALVMRPPGAIEPAFGEGSCERHLDLARQAGVPHATEQVDGLALDLDTPADIVALTTKIEMARDGGGNPAPRTAAVLGI
ncbi:MAG: 2-phospho-L-lactate guanylyltransferase [Solirubrobacterales bacterium]|nr:2-phospho-L-lactate guanylyltransferase [Solirubrobacterales bacterium]HRV59430.1 2-phospho-L-lactate guanylyltransferase [Solirubrobacterales bacterium]